MSYSETLIWIIKDEGENRIKTHIKLFKLRKETAGLRSLVIYKFSCAGCSACYIGETNRHFATRIREHLASDKNSHILKHLRGSENNCRSLCSEDGFKILDSASTSFQLKIKEAMHILWEQPSLNSQVKHLNLSLFYCYCYGYGYGVMGLWLWDRKSVV